MCRLTTAREPAKSVRMWAGSLPRLQLWAYDLSASEEGPARISSWSRAMEDTVRLYTIHFANRAYIRSVCEGLAFLAASTIAIFAAVSYATVHASNPVT